jgi:AcrR family transcriptional regulator
MNDAYTDRILLAALAEFSDFGLRRVSMEDIARRAGVNRVTIYRRFASKDTLVQATLISHAQRMLGLVAVEVAGLSHFDDRVVAGFSAALRAARADRLLTVLRTREQETFLPLMTVEGGPILAAVRSFFAAELAAAGDGLVANPEAAAEVAARLSASLFLTPDSCFALDDDAQLRHFAREVLLPACRAAGTSDLSVLAAVGGSGEA